MTLRILQPLLQEDYDTVSDAAMQVQAALNASAGIGVKAQTAPFNASRVDGIIGRVSGAEQFDDISWMLNEPIINLSQSIVDDTLRANVDFQGKTGLQPKVVRTAERKCCEWCSKLEGEYTYPDVPKDVYRRHANCRCEVEYDPGSGKRRNVWTKRWTAPEERDKIEARKVMHSDHAEKTIQTRINKGEYSLEQSHQQYLKHVFGTPQYQQYETTRIAKGSTAQGRLTIQIKNLSPLTM